MWQWVKQFSKQYYPWDPHSFHFDYLYLTEFSYLQNLENVQLHSNVIL